MNRWQRNGFQRSKVMYLDFLMVGSFLFLFNSKEERDLIFIAGPYLLRSKALFLSHQTLDFDLGMKIYIAPGWVRLLHLPIFLWDETTSKDISDMLTHYIDKVEPKGSIYSCTRIYVEIDLNKGLLEAIQLNMAKWMHL